MLDCSAATVLIPAFWTRIATGFNSQGIQTGPGVGMALAEWMVDGDPGRTLNADFAELDIRRFHPVYANGTEWCTSRALEGRH